MTEPVEYMARSHAYYQAQGFERKYRYAHHDAVPFQPLQKPLSEATVGLITTASLHPRKSLEPRQVASANSSPSPERLFADDLSWDKDATHLDDLNTYLPLQALQASVVSGRIGALAPRFHCAPTEYSHRTTLEHDAPELHRRLLDDRADVVVLVPL